MIYKRIQEFMLDKKLTTSDLAQELKEKAHRIQAIRNGRQKVPEDVMVKLVEKFNVNSHWLLTGNGPMYLPSKKTGETREINEGVTSYGVAAAPVDLKQNWGKLNDRQKREITERVEEMVEVNVLKEFVTKFATQSGQILPAKSSATL